MRHTFPGQEVCGSLVVAVNFVLTLALIELNRIVHVQNGQEQLFFGW